MVQSHFEVVSAYPSYRVAKALKPLPFREVWRPMLKAFALNEAAPTSFRAFALRLYRAALYSDAV